MKRILLLIVLMCSATMWAQSKTTGIVNLLPGMTAQLELNSATTTATLTFTGPSDRWYALQFGSFATGGGMQAGQDVVYYNGTTLVDAVHNGQGIAPTTDGVNNWTVTSNTVAGGTRTIVATRPFNTSSAQDFTFNYSDTTIDFAFSRMDSPSFVLAYHGSNRGYALNRAFTCVAPLAPTASPQTFCSGATVANLSATGAAGATFSWYNVPNGGTALASTTALTTGNYYVSQTVSACESTRTMVAVTINTVNAPSAPAQIVCPGATIANLNVTGAAGATFTWYDALTGGNVVAGTTVVTTGNYYVSQTVGTCESPRATKAVTVNNVNQPTVEPQTVCIGATIADLAVTGAAGATFTWYDALTGGNVVAGTAVVATGNYFVSQTVGGCESTRATKAVTVFDPEEPTAANQTFCEGATVADLEVTSTNGNVSWYTDAAGGTALPLNTVLTTGDYHVSQTTGTCESGRTMIMVTITPVPDEPGGAATQTFTAGEIIADLDITTETGAIITWYMNTGGDLEEVPVTTLLTDGTVYFVTQTLNNCESDYLQITADEALSSESFEATGFIAYPNPMGDRLTITNKGSISVVIITNLLGQEVMKAEADTETVTVDTSKLGAGTYIVKVRAESGESASLKVIKI
jgi:hypothetical protein